MTKNIFVAGSFLLLMTTGIKAQEQKSVQTMADEYYTRYEYKAAAILYSRVATKKNVHPEVLKKLALCYSKLNAYQDAANIYQRIINLPTAKAEDFLHYADALKSLEKYEEAKEQYFHYAKLTRQNVNPQMAGCDSALLWKNLYTNYTIENRSELNTASSDWGAVWYGNKLVFISDSLRYTMLDPATKPGHKKAPATDRSYQKLYFVDTIQNQPPVTLIRGIENSINQYRFHIGPVTFSTGLDTAYLTITNPNHITHKKEKSKVLYGTRRLQLLICIKKDGKWEVLEPFTYNNPEEYSLGHAALSHDGRYLYYASDMPGGIGKTDIWYSEKQQDGSWGTPVNCGPLINTPDEEAFPVVNGDHELHFSSKGHPGLGGFDIFYAKGNASNWTVPVNMRPPVNSAGDDFLLVQQGAQGFFASNRQGGKGEDDIYSFKQMTSPNSQQSSGKPVKILQTQVIDLQTRQPIGDAVVTLYNKRKEVSWTQLLGPGGKNYNVLEDAVPYLVFAAKDQYAPSEMHIFSSDTLSTDTLRMTLYLTKATPAHNDIITLQNIYYDLDKYTIRPEAYPVLDSLVAFMKRFPALKVEVGAHTDSRATAAYNLELSNNRAAAIVNYLVKKGISPERMVAKGYGKSKLVNRCEDGVECSEEEHQANRRTEIKILH
ncbi:MAG: OmpA family protein [Chitinophaga sp.]|uniref:OmpA family protein n=1 Tax=Chitinophaga sp. TaxID=1869181 RepID=UPI0025C6445E|nr:OmpA family protein [Chitinophaga sp.]MBV8253644.1 OmpA family protein [Chitinophaga sp.]